MKIDAILCRPLSGERGMALVSALLLLLVISLLAVGLSMDASMDVRAAGSQRFKATSFANAEAGLVASLDILEDNIYDVGWVNPSPPDPFEFPNLSDIYDGSLDIEQDGVFYMDENPDPNPNRIMSMTGDLNAEIITQRLYSDLNEGGAVQVAGGYGGAGKSLSSGGAKIIYNVMGTADTEGQAVADLGVYYRNVSK